MLTRKVQNDRLCRTQSWTLKDLRSEKFLEKDRNFLLVVFFRKVIKIIELRFWLG
jgi:hypothetical protein